MKTWTMVAPGYYMADEYPVEPTPMEPAPPPGPEIPWECHNTKPVNTAAAWAAVVAMCEGAK